MVAQHWLIIAIVVLVNVLGILIMTKILDDHLFGFVTRPGYGNNVSKNESFPLLEEESTARQIHTDHPSPGFFVNITQTHVQYQFYFMEMEEMLQRMGGGYNLSAVIACQTLAGKKQNDAFRHHKRRTGDIYQADILILEAGDDRETNWPVYQNSRYSFINTGQSCNRPKFFQQLNHLYQSAYIQYGVWTDHPHLKHMLIMDNVNEIDAKVHQNDTRFIFFGVNNHEKSPHFRRMITMPPPLMRASEQHNIKKLDESYLIVFQGDCKNPVRRRVAELQKEIADDDVFIHCNHGKGQRGNNNMLDVIASSKFALDLGGDAPWTYRFSEIMLAGTVLVRIDEHGNKWELPFHHLVDWNKIAILFDASVLQNASTWRSQLTQLHGMTEETYGEMKSTMRNVVDYCFQSWERKIHCLLMDIEVAYLHTNDTSWTE